MSAVFINKLLFDKNLFRYWSGDRFLEKVSIALVGCGGIASSHVSGYRDLYTQNLRVFNIRALCDISVENSKEKRRAITGFQQCRPEIYDDFEEMLRKESLDAVDICLPHNMHHNVALKCLQEGLHVIIEKPLGITMRAAKKIMDEAEKRRKVLAVAENYRRTPQNRAIWWAIRQGMIGEPRMVMWAASYWGPRPWGWREDKFVAGGSWVFDGGVHLADLDRYQLGMEAVEVYSVNCTFDQVKGGVKVTVDDMTMATIRYNKRVYAQWFWARAAPAKRVNMRVIYGSKGALTERELLTQKGESVEVKRIETIRSEMTRSLKREEKERWFPRGVTNTFATELYDFYDSIVNKRKPEVDGIEAYRDMAIPLGFYESAVLNRPVKIRDIEEMKIEEYQREINEKLGI